MKKAKGSGTSDVKNNSSRPALSPENRENQLISMAYDHAEQQFREGTASSQVTVHFLKLGTAKAKLELAKLEHETMLMRAKTEAIEAQKRSDELFERALKAFGTYGGSDGSDDY